MGILADYAMRARAVVKWLTRLPGTPEVAPWFACVIVIAAAVSLIVAIPLSEAGVRIAGMLLSTSGFLTAGAEIVAVRRRHAVRGPIVAVRDWWQSRPGSRHTATATLNVRLGDATVSGRGRVIRQIGPEHSPEVRLNALAQSVADIHRELDAMHGESEKRFTELRAKLAAETAARTAALAAMETAARQAETARLDVAGAAIVAGVVGLVLLALPVEIAGWVAR